MTAVHLDLESGPAGSPKALLWTQSKQCPWVGIKHVRSTAQHQLSLQNSTRAAWPLEGKECEVTERHPRRRPLLYQLCFIFIQFFWLKAQPAVPHKHLSKED